MTVDNVEIAYIMLLGVQCVHSVEELSSGFHKKWYLFVMPFPLFLAFEIALVSFWLLVLLYADFPHRETLMSFFNLLMFANGIQHLVWAGVVKKYVPGLITAPFFIVIFLWFYL